MKIKIIGVFPSFFSSVATFMQGKNKVFFSTQINLMPVSKVWRVGERHHTVKSRDYGTAKVQMLRCPALAPQGGITRWLQEKIFLPIITEYGGNWQNSSLSWRHTQQGRRQFLQGAVVGFLRFLSSYLPAWRHQTHLWVTPGVQWTKLGAAAEVISSRSCMLFW